MERLASIEKRYQEIEILLTDPDVSTDRQRVQSLAKEHASLKGLASLSREYHRVTQELEDARTISRDESDRELASMAREELSRLRERKDSVERELRLALLPKDPNDEKNVIMEVRAGAGGEEAGLFAADLYRMYQRHAQRKGWKTEVISSNETGLGSIKEIVFQVKGDGAYSRLKHESGGHRVQRIPITESGGRIHTSAATVAVLPEAEEVDVDIDPGDLQIDIFHSSGHGGQNVQKVATAVRITHTPTGINAVCQDERSQLKNKAKAMAVVRSRLLARKIEEQQREITEARRSQIGTGDRSDRVRTYNYPQDRVTDHRASLTSYNLEEVLDGDIDRFIDALLSMEQALRLEEAGI
jgi:peptide chain release factor 1